MQPGNTSHPSSPTPFWFDSMISPEGAFGALMKNAQNSFEGSFRALSDETLQFINKRLEHNGEAIEQCRDCRDVGALMTAQQKWFMDFAQDYYEEAVRMGEVTRKMFANGVSSNGVGASDPRADKHA